MKMFHVTWDIHLDNIRRHGLLPNHKPNGWPPLGRAASRGKNFLCVEDAIGYWAGTIYDNLRPPKGADLLVVLVVDLTGLETTLDTRGEGQDGDRWTREAIPPERILEVKDVQPWLDKWLCRT